MKKQKLLKLNLGCGDNKLKGYVNIDGEKLCKPDLVLDITERRLPFKDNSVSEAVMFHCIEHIEKIKHPVVFLEVNRVLTPGGKFYLGYPNFWECAKRWKLNVNGERKFWEATLYGRQLYPRDYHVCAMNPDELAQELHLFGFKDIVSFKEQDEEYNTITMAIKDGPPLPTYEDVVAEDIRSMRLSYGDHSNTQVCKS